jgi:uncharacterized RDD family membrane protein YckC
MGAVFYDALLLLAVVFLATVIVLPLNAGEAFSAGQQYFYRAYLLAISFVFYAWFWTHGGQTLGMRAWKIKLCDQQGANVDWVQALGRFVAAVLSWAILGLGFFWCLFDKERLCWHDRLSGTRLVQIDREKDGLKK